MKPSLRWDGTGSIDALREESRAKLWELLGMDMCKPCEPVFEITEDDVVNGNRRIHFTIQTEEGYYTHCDLMLPMEMPEGKLPLDVGAIVMNCTTLASLARYCATGMPLVEKWVTVDGTAVKNPQNVIVPVGMRMKDVFEACGGFLEEPRKVLYGGPMMGISVPDLNQPILKNTNAILAFGAKEAVLPKSTACIKCGKCISACPLNLMPVEIETAYKLNKMEMLDKLKVNICMECGCCSYGCPANRPLVQTNKLAKARLAAWRAEQKAQSDASKEAAK